MELFSGNIKKSFDVTMVSLILVHLLHFFRRSFLQTEK